MHSRSDNQINTRHPYCACLSPEGYHHNRSAGEGRGDCCHGDKTGSTRGAGCDLIFLVITNVAPVSVTFHIYAVGARPDAEKR